MPEATATYPRALIFRKAWVIARHQARHAGGSPRQHLPAALRQAWADQKRIDAAIAAMRARVLACVAQLRAEAQARRNDQGTAASVIPLPLRPKAPAAVGAASGREAA